MGRPERRRQAKYLRNYVNATDPGTAAMLSVLPGVGQMYNGEQRKGVLFLEVALLNLIMLGLFLMTQSIASGLESLGAQCHFTVNRDVAQILGRSHVGSPLFFVYASLCLSFVIYAVRDAYRRAGVIKRNPIYKSQILELSEAASGSYIFHVTAILTFLFLALFCVIPVPPSAQITEIQFVYNQPEIKKTTITKTASDKPSIDSGKHEKKKQIKVHTNSPSNTRTSNKEINKKQIQKTAVDTTSAPRVLPIRPNLIATDDAPAPVLPGKRIAVPSPPRPVAPRLISPLPKPSAPSLNRSSAINYAPPAPTRLNTLARPGAAPVPSPGAVGRLQALSTGALQPAPVKVPSGGNAGNLPTIKPGSQIIAALPSAPKLPSIGDGNTGSGESKPAPQPIISGGQSGNKHGSGKQSGPAPTTITSKPGNSGGRMVAMAPTLNPGAAGKPGAATSGNPRANSRPGAAPSIAAVPVDFGPYMADLQRRIKRAWHPPTGQETRRVIVTFTVHRNGSMSHLRLSNGSGAAIADKAALDAVANAAPFRQLPDGAESSVDIEFTFDYNVFSGGGGSFRRL